MPFEISSFKRIVVLTGAGISAESGISTFRDSNGLWESHRLEDVATPEAFLRDPVLVWQFYSMRRRAAVLAKPNAAHLALSDFSLRCEQNSTELTLVTQNVDALHERANLRWSSSKTQPSHPIAMHGTLSQSRCTRCEKIFADANIWFNESGQPLADETPEIAPLAGGSPKLEHNNVKRNSLSIPLAPCCSAALRPHIVWFGEIPLHMDYIVAQLARCDLFLTIGSSGQVYPAAGFLEQAKFAGATTACINKEPIPQQGMVDFYLEGLASQAVPSIFHQ